MIREFSLGCAFAAFGLIAGACNAASTDAASRADCDAPAPWRVLHASPPDNGIADARAVWLDARRLLWPGHDGSGRYRLHVSTDGGIVAAPGAKVHGADASLDLIGEGSGPDTEAKAGDAAIPSHFAYLGSGVVLTLRRADAARIDTLLRGQLVLTLEDKRGRVIDATGTQLAAVLDDRYASARNAPALGATPVGERMRLRLWAPSARAVAVCRYASGDGTAVEVAPLRRDDASGVWSVDVDDGLRYYTFLVDVFMPGTGLVRERVTDPYAVSLGTDSARGYIADLDDAATKPEGWDAVPVRPALAAATDQIVYELHVRDFSVADETVRPAWRGKYLAFAENESAGMRHLRALAAAGLTDVHLLPVFDFAGVPESGCVSPQPHGAPDGIEQQALIAQTRARDCYNWGYAPLHFGAPEGSYASDAADGNARIVELRQVVQALHRAGLRVGLDVVYNHTQAAGQDAQATLDRIVPGYYHRLDAKGKVEISTCCANSATEHAMMARLMIDTAVRWVRDYRIDSFRFDLMGHQPRAEMEKLQVAVDAAADKHIDLLGEGWNFGEVKDGTRFVQASQLSLAGAHIASFSDRARDALRGGSAMDIGDDLVRRQGWLNGLGYAPNALAQGRDDRAELLHAADLVRAGLAGTLRDYTLANASGEALPLARFDYNGQPAGYAASPDEVVNYVENHDNPTLFDIDALRLPVATGAEDRARVQLLGLAVVAFSQGIAYFHAGGEILRSKSLDRNSNESGDWFNALDWSRRDNGFARGLPPAADNEASWPVMRPVLTLPAAKPDAKLIDWTRRAFLDLLRIRAGTTLLRLRTAEDVKTRLRFVDGGPKQEPTLIAAHLDGNGYAGAGFRELMFFLNADVKAHELVVRDERAKAWTLHPLQRSPQAADARVRTQSRYARSRGAFAIPPRSAVVFVIE